MYKDDLSSETFSTSGILSDYTLSKIIEIVSKKQEAEKVSRLREIKEH